MSQNLIEQTMTNAQRDAMLADIEAFLLKYEAFKVNLNAEQIKRLARIKETDIAQMEAAQTFAQQNPTAIPGDVNVAGLNLDLALAHQIVLVNTRIQQAADIVRISLIAALSDGLVTSGLIYRLEQAKGRTPQNQNFLDTYGARYAHSPQPPATPPAPPA